MRLILRTAIPAVVALSLSGLARGEDREPLLRTLAEQAGGRYARELSEKEIVGERQYETIGALADQSDLVIVGRILSAPRYSESQAGRSIVATYKVIADEIWKGGLLPTQVVSVAEPGGVITLSSNSTAALLRRGPYRPLESSRAYVMFLVRRTDGNGYQLVGGPQGAFAFDEAGRVRPADERPSSRVGSQYRMQPKDVLLADVREATRAR